MRTWEDDILPRWDVAIRERRNRELWWMGIAPRSRGRVWQRAIGNQLGLTPISFEAALSRAREAKARIQAGGGVVMPVTEVGGGTSLALMTDPAGNQVGFITQG